jgi:hypothetical protein
LFDARTRPFCVVGPSAGYRGSKALELCARVAARVVRDTSVRRLRPEVTAISDRIIISIGCRACDSHSLSKSGKYCAFLIGDGRCGIMRKNGIQSRNTTKLNRCRSSKEWKMKSPFLGQGSAEKHHWQRIRTLDRSAQPRTGGIVLRR